MKKAISLFLVFVLCLSLCACADLNFSAIGGGHADDCRDCYTKILGEWFSITEDNQLLRLSFGEDGIVNLGEQEYPWYTNCKERHSIIIGNNPRRYCVAMGEETVTLAEWDKMYRADEIPVLYKNENYTFQEITEENWQEYFGTSFEDVFDIDYTFEWNEPTVNAWGETITAEMGTYYKKATLKQADRYAFCHIMLECRGYSSVDRVNIDAETSKITGYDCVEVEEYADCVSTYTTTGASFIISYDADERFDEETNIHAVQLDTILRMKGWIVFA